MDNESRDAATIGRRSKDSRIRLERLLTALLVHHTPNLPAMKIAMRICPKSLWRRILHRPPRFTLMADRTDPVHDFANLVLQLELAGSRMSGSLVTERLSRLADIAADARNFVLCIDVDPRATTAHQQLEAAALAADLDPSQEPRR